MRWLWRYNIVFFILFVICISVRKQPAERLSPARQKKIFVPDSLFLERNKQVLITPLPNSYTIYKQLVCINRQSQFVFSGDMPFYLKKYITTEFNQLFAKENDFVSAPIQVGISSYLNRYSPCAENLKMDIAYKHKEEINDFLVFNIFIQFDEQMRGENYLIKTDFFSRQIVVRGGMKGLFYGLVSLTQLLNHHFEEKRQAALFYGLDIIDEPRFAHRGMHLDVARHFFSKEVIKTYLDILAFHKINVFHFHLTDDQGWRIEIKAYPKLTSIGSCRRETIVGRDRLQIDYPTDNTPHYGFYTQKDIQEIVRYAQEKNIEIIPEVDLPGHSMAMIASYPEMACFQKPYEVLTRWRHTDDLVCAGKENNYNMIGTILREIGALFPSNYIHLGGDESKLLAWKKCPACQQKMNALGIDEKGLLHYFFSTLRREVPNKKVILWDDEFSDSWDKDFILMCWKGEKNVLKALNGNRKVILNNSEYYYFDHYQSPNMAEQPLAFKQVSTIKELYMHRVKANHLMGIQGALWTEYITSKKQLEYMLLPRLLALSEVAWTQFANMNYVAFTQRVEYEKKYFDKLHLNYFGKPNAHQVKIVATENELKAP